MTRQTSDRETLEQGIRRELESLTSEIEQLAAEIRQSVGTSSERLREVWDNLDEERKRFVGRIEQAAGETRARRERP